MPDSSSGRAGFLNSPFLSRFGLATVRTVGRGRNLSNLYLVREIGQEPGAGSRPGSQGSGMMLALPLRLSQPRVDGVRKVDELQLPCEAARKQTLAARSADFRVRSPNRVIPQWRRLAGALGLLSSYRQGASGLPRTTPPLAPSFILTPRGGLPRPGATRPGCTNDATMGEVVAEEVCPGRSFIRHHHVRSKRDVRRRNGSPPLFICRSPGPWRMIRPWSQNPKSMLTSMETRRTLSLRTV